MIDQWHERAQAYWRVRSARDDYFWVHRLFEECYNVNAHFRTIWDALPKVSADGPHRYLPYDQTLAKPVSADDVRLVKEASTPVLKLTHKLESIEYSADSVLGFLCSRALAPREKSETAGSKAGPQDEGHITTDRRRRWGS